MPRSPQARGLLLGLLGVSIFSLTLPMTRLAVAELDPLWVGTARAVVAAVPAGLWLWWRRAPLPERDMVVPLLLVVAGIVIGFPTLTSIAMTLTDASHAAVVLGVLPLATAAAGALRSGERPSRRFWLAAGAGALLVTGFALRAGAGSVSAADLLLVAATLAAAVGYAEGARLSARIGGPATICWALVVSAPVLAVPAIWLGWRHGLQAGASAWLGFFYVAIFSQLLGFFAWYRGLVLGGITRVSQVQLLQLFLTITFAALLVGESPGTETWLFGATVVAVVAIASRARIGSQQAAKKPADNGGRRWGGQPRP
jgi:drug/metabolite transporter (DMT)-like permease